MVDDDREKTYEVSAIHNSAGYKRVRQTLASQYDLGNREPDIQVVAVDRRGDRSLALRHTQSARRPLASIYTEVLKHVARLWGFPVRIESVDEQGKTELIGHAHP